MYIRREIEATIDAMLTQGKVVLVTGARQVGKTTVLKEHLGDTFSYVSMENPRDYLLAKQDAVLFFDSHDLPLIIDEVQRVPELFSPVKWIVDQSDQHRAHWVADVPSDEGRERVPGRQDQDSRDALPQPEGVHRGGGQPAFLRSGTNC